MKNSIRIVAAAFAALVCLTQAGIAGAAEIKVLSALGIKEVLPIRLTQHGAICCGGPSEENRDASSRLPADPWRVPSALFYGRRVPAIPQRVALAGRVSVSSVSTCGGVFRCARSAAAVQGVSLPDLGHGGDRDASDTRAPARLVLGSLSGDHTYAGVLRVAAPTAARPGAV